MSEVVFRALSAALDHIQDELGPAVFSIAAANNNLRAMTSTADTDERIFARTIRQLLLLCSNERHRKKQGSEECASLPHGQYDISFEEFETFY